MAGGSVIWGEVAERFGLRTTLLIAGITMLIAAALTARLRLTGSHELDTTPSNHWPEPPLLVERHPEDGPVLVMAEYSIDSQHGPEFARALHPVARIALHARAVRLNLYGDAA